jgi:hypothetical protein
MGQASVALRAVESEIITIQSNPYLSSNAQNRFDSRALAYTPSMAELTAGWADDQSFEVRLDGDVSHVNVTSDVHLQRTGDALLAFLLPVAMATGSRFAIKDEVDERLMRSQARVQEVLTFWFRNLKRVSVDAPTVRRQPRPNVSSFFSGGVDSSYTALKHRSELTQLVFVHGFDTHQDQEALRAEISRRLGGAADTLGIPLVEISTNLRDVTDRYFGWAFYHGAALAGISHMLDSRISIVPATHTYADVFEWGSHPLLDPLWSSGSVHVEHDGANVSRTEKIRTIVRDRDALGWLRVCYRNPDQAYNCGRCEKCVRTMLSLHALGALEQAPTFPNDIDPRTVRRLRFLNRNSLAFAKENLQILDGPLHRALLTAYLASMGRRAAAQVSEKILTRGPSWAGPSIRRMRWGARALWSLRTGS